MRKLALYAAAAAITMSITAPISTQAAVRMFVMNGNCNGIYSGGGCSNQGMNLSDILSTLCQNSFSCKNPSSTLDILQPNLPSQGCQNQNIFSQGCPDIIYPNLNQNCWNQSCPSETPDCQGQNCPDDTPNCSGQDCPNETPGCQGQDCPGEIPNVPNQNQPSQNQPGQNQPSQGNDASASYVQQVISLVNEERAKAGLAPLVESDKVAQAANVRAQEIVRSFSHTRPNGSSFSTALQQSGVTYRGAGENIAYGQRTAAEVMDGWMNSSGHRANILNRNYTTIGVGYYESNGVKYWVQLFTY